MSTRKPTRAAALGVTDDDYARMLAAQDGHCALCPSTPKRYRFHIDHDHKTGVIRGLLCHRCNRVMWSWVDGEWLRRAAAYLDRAGTQHEHGNARAMLDNSTAAGLTTGGAGE